ncbi:MAG: hypothetical protein H6840_00950 [Planctomycetes bacterium]|nr:hypothetical protein [Planctomycetota bacterium]
MEKLRISGVERLLKADVDNLTRLREVTVEWLPDDVEEGQFSEGLEALIGCATLQRLEIDWSVPLSTVPKECFVKSTFSSVAIIDYGVIERDEVAWIAWCPNVECVSIKGGKVVESGVYDGLAKLRNIKEIELAIPDKGADSAGKPVLGLSDYYIAKIVNANPAIETISISYSSKLTAAGLSRLQGCKRLRHFGIAGCPSLSSKLVEQILSSHSLNSIHMDFSCVESHEDVALSLKAIGQRQGLVKVSLSGLPNRANKSLADLLLGASMDSLALMHSEWPLNVGKGDIVKNSIKTLQLSHIDGFEAGYLRSCVEMEELQIEDDYTESSQLASSIQKCVTLRRLSLHRTAITFEDLSKVTGSLTALREMSIDGLRGPVKEVSRGPLRIRVLICLNLDQDVIDSLLSRLKEECNVVELRRSRLGSETMRLLANCTKIKMISLAHSRYSGDLALVKSLVAESEALDAIDLSGVGGIDWQEKQMLQAGNSDVYVSYDDD